PVQDDPVSIAREHALLDGIEQVGLEAKPLLRFDAMRDVSRISDDPPDDGMVEEIRRRAFDDPPRAVFVADARRDGGALPPASMTRCIKSSTRARSLGWMISDNGRPVSSAAVHPSTFFTDGFT